MGVGVEAAQVGLAKLHAVGGQVAGACRPLRERDVDGGHHMRGTVLAAAQGRHAEARVSAVVEPDHGNRLTDDEPVGR